LIVEQANKAFQPTKNKALYEKTMHKSEMKTWVDVYIEEEQNERKG